jgi:Family of unknown function (DUF5996)
MTSNLNSINWPSLPLAEWDATRATVHMWTQIVGKTRMVLSPRQNHYWHVTLYVTPRGLNTSPIPIGKQTFDTEFDFAAHQLVIRTSGGQIKSMPLYPRSVADFYAEYMACLRALGIEMKIHRKPQEVEDTTPFDEDRHHASYDAEYIERFQRVLTQADRVMKEFRARFLGKCSPVHFFWGSFDMAVTRFSGRPAHQPATADPMTREAYSHEVSSCGFWPGDLRFPHPAFYAYMAPAPAGLDKAIVHPGGWSAQLGEHLLEYDAVRELDAPEEAILSFFQSSYEVGAGLANWDRSALECPK